MALESKKYLYDILRATTLLTDFTAGKVLEDYTHDPREIVAFRVRQ